MSAYITRKGFISMLVFKRSGSQEGWRVVTHHEMYAIYSLFILPDCCFSLLFVYDGVEVNIWNESLWLCFQQIFLGGPNRAVFLFCFVLELSKARTKTVPQFWQRNKVWTWTEMESEKKTLHWNRYWTTLECIICVTLIIWQLWESAQLIRFGLRPKESGALFSLRRASSHDWLYVSCSD